MGVHLGDKQLSFTSTELKETTGHLIRTSLQGIRNTGMGVKRNQSKKCKFMNHRENWRKERVSAFFFEWLLREKTKGQGSGREGDSSLAVLDSGYQEQTTKLQCYIQTVLRVDRTLLSITVNL